MKNEKESLRLTYKKSKSNKMYEDWLEDQYLKLMKEYQELLDKSMEKDIQKIINSISCSPEEAKEALLMKRHNVDESIFHIIKKRNRTRE